MKNKPNTLREKISKILVKWDMPTRQVAVDDIIKLFETIIEEEKPKEKRPLIRGGYSKDEKGNPLWEHSNLKLTLLNGK